MRIYSGRRDLPVSMTTSTGRSAGFSFNLGRTSTRRLVRRPERRLPTAFAHDRLKDETPTPRSGPRLDRRSGWAGTADGRARQAGRVYTAGLHIPLPRRGRGPCRAWGPAAGARL